METDKVVFTGHKTVIDQASEALRVGNLEDGLPLPVPNVGIELAALIEVDVVRERPAIEVAGGLLALARQALHGRVAVPFMVFAKELGLELAIDVLIEARLRVDGNVDKQLVVAPAARALVTGGGVAHLRISKVDKSKAEAL